MVKQLKDARIGTRLGDYEIMGVLATGGMARLYIGKDVNLEREAAVKVLTQEMVESDSFLAERFLREAKAVAALDHPNIVPIFQYGQQDDVYFLVMKLIRGRDFADEINDLQAKGQRMSVERMMHVLKQTAAALDHAHLHGIIHRDVKPSNILIDAASDRAILTDFGLVLRQTEIDKTMGTAFGTPRYISPEQALASESVVPQSDIYSLAVIVYEILTGSQVFKADTAMQVALSHISEPPPAPRTLNPDIPEVAEKEILKALEKEPENRHKTALEFIRALADAYGERIDADTGMKVTAGMPRNQTSQGAEQKKSQNNLTVFVVIAVVLVVGIVMLLLLAGGGGESDGGESTGGESDLVAPAGGIESIVVEATLGDPQTIQAIYDANTFAIRNSSDMSVSVDELTILRDEVTGFDGTALVNAQRLAPGECVVIADTAQRVTLPRDWECGPVRNQILRYEDGIFWRGAAGTFTVNPPRAEQVECPLTDGAMATCDITLPSIVTDAE